LLGNEVRHNIWLTWMWTSVESVLLESIVTVPIVNGCCRGIYIPVAWIDPDIILADRCGSRGTALEGAVHSLATAD
jgi:hypothetical protein